MTDKRCAAADGAYGFVLAVREQRHGLSFWNARDGFGALRDASVLSEADAAHMSLPTSTAEPEWLAMPRPLRGD